MARSRWGDWNPETDRCPECHDGDNIPFGCDYHCNTCDAEWSADENEGEEPND